MSQSRTSISRSELRAALRLLACSGLALVALLFGCKAKSHHIAELTKADAPVERQAGTGAWAGADVGTKYFLGDALVGSPETVAQQLADWAIEYKPNAVTLLFYNCIDDLSTFSEHVIPSLAKRLDEAGFPLVLESEQRDQYTSSPAQ